MILYIVYRQKKCVSLMDVTNEQVLIKKERQKHCSALLTKPME